MHMPCLSITATDKQQMSNEIHEYNACVILFTEVVIVVLCVIRLCLSANDTDFQSPQWGVIGEIIAGQVMLIRKGNNISAIPVDAFAEFPSLQVFILNI